MTSSQKVNPEVRNWSSVGNQGQTVQRAPDRTIMMTQVRGLAGNAVHRSGSEPTRSMIRQRHGLLERSTFFTTYLRQEFGA